MMNLEQAIAYGKRTGVKYYLKDGGNHIIGGYRTMEAAKDAKTRFEEEDKTDPFCTGTTYHIEEIVNA